MIRAANAVMAASAIAAAAPSIALALKFRVTASALVVGCWSAILASYILLLSLGTPRIRQLVGPRPQQFERYVGSQRFVVPWQYQPVGADVLNSSGFSVRICKASFRGAYELGCEGSSQVGVSPADTGFGRQFDVTFWRDRLPEMKVGEIHHGHQEYSYAPALDAQGRTTTTRYFVRRAPDGQSSRLVVCYASGGCRHHVRAADYALSYDAPEAKLAEWETMDRDLTALIDSWRK